MTPEEAVEILRRCEFSIQNSCPDCDGSAYGLPRYGNERHAPGCKFAELLGMFEMFTDCEVALYRDVRGQLVEVDAPDYRRLNGGYDTVTFKPQAEWGTVTHWRLVPRCEKSPELLTEFITFTSHHRLRKGDTLTLKMHRSIDMRSFNPTALRR